MSDEWRWHCMALGERERLAAFWFHEYKSAAGVKCEARCACVSMKQYFFCPEQIFLVVKAGCPR